MKQLTIGTVLFLLAISATARAVEAPHQIAGYSLGSQLEEYDEKVKYDTLFPLRDSKFIHEVEIRAPQGFKSGLLWAGNCAKPGRIARIRLKYQDPSKKFYEQLLKRFKQRFGDPSEWQGDPFHIVLAWKWTFTDPQGNRISLVLEHNTRDREESIGNSVKLTMWNLIDEERQCFEKKASAESKKKTPTKKQKPSWDQLIPQ